jgi:hypothetical protein
MFLPFFLDFTRRGLDIFSIFERKDDWLAVPLSRYVLPIHKSLQNLVFKVFMILADVVDESQMRV